jgi:hypothetical protein
LVSGLQYVRPVYTTSGRDLDNADNFKFIYDGFTEFHNIIEIDDFAESGLFRRFYNDITGAREINRKNHSGFTLDYPESGKMVFTSKYEIQDTEVSTYKRVFIELFSNYYNEKRSLYSKFGRLLYNDFTQDEWNKFYNLIARCIQLQMRLCNILFIGGEK